MHNSEYNLDFQYYLSEKTDIDLEIITKLFEKEIDVFKIALTIIEEYGIDEKTLGKIWGNYLGFAYVDPNASIVNQEYTNKVGIDFILENKALPLYKFGKAVTVATPNPTNPFIQDKMEKKLGELVSFVFCFPFDIEIYIQFLNFKKPEI